MSADASEKSLAELCSVCYTSQPKYRCPRCKTQTCSLPCYKRHQQRASCNGQRDPAAYLRKSEWATPSGIDRDYNYLKTVERRVETGTKDLSDRGISGRPPARHGKAGDGRVAKSWAPGSALQRYLGENGIRVERAPAGMSRSKANRTRVTPKGRVMWTVEFVEGDGERRGEKRSLDESSEGRTVGELWEEVVARRVNAEARGMGRKRKRGEARQDDAKPGVKDGAEPLAQSASISEAEAARGDEDATDRATTGTQHGVNQKDTEQKDAQRDDPALDGAEQQDAEPENAQQHPTQQEVTKQEASKEENPALEAQNTNDPTPSPPKHFYLEKSLTASSARILIPISATSTLTASLSNRTVLEYPTFYVFSGGPEELPEGFQLEDEYSKAREAESKDVEALLAQTGGQEGKSGEGEGEEGGVDVEGILSMLARDVGA